MSTAEDFLQETETGLTQVADAMEGATEVGRRQFVFMSLVAAAATTFGVDALRAQASGGGAPADTAAAGATSDSARQRRAAVDDVPGVARRHRRADGETGEGARTRRVRPRSVLASTNGAAPVPTSDDEIAYLPGASAISTH